MREKGRKISEKRFEQTKEIRQQKREETIKGNYMQTKRKNGSSRGVTAETDRGDGVSLQQGPNSFINEMSCFQRWQHFI